MSLANGTLTPAYGRDYKSKAEVLADFKAGKDFMFNGPFERGYCSIADAVPGERVKLRYKKLTQFVFFDVPPGSGPNQSDGGRG